MDLIHLDQPYRNTPFQGHHLHTRPLAAAMGAEVLDTDVRTLSDDAFDELQQALFHHKMIYLRNQSLTPDDQAQFTLRFGEFGTDAYTTGLPGYPDVQPVVKEAQTKSKMIFGGGWHTDSAFLEEPPSISLLYGVEIPPYGGDTTWYNTALAYESLTPAMRAMLAPLKVHMSGIKVVNSMRKLAKDAAGMDAMGDIQLELDIQAMIDGQFHPLVRRHPNSGEVALYCDDVYAQGIEGMTEYEARPLLNFLVAHITQEIFCCRLRWEANMLVLWDNRICLHRAFNDYDGFRREMHRTTVKGERPVGLSA